MNGITIDLECQDKLAASFQKLTNIKRPFIYTSEGSIAVTKEAQKNALEMDRDAPILASAVIVNNTAQKLLADFYYFFRPQHPFEVYTSFQKGINWLNDFQPTRKPTKDKALNHL